MIEPKNEKIFPKSYIVKKAVTDKFRKLKIFQKVLLVELGGE